MLCWTRYPMNSSVEPSSRRSGIATLISRRHAPSIVCIPSSRPRISAAVASWAWAVARGEGRSVPVTVMLVSLLGLSPRAVRSGVVAGCRAPPVGPHHATGGGGPCHPGPGETCRVGHGSPPERVDRGDLVRAEREVADGEVGRDPVGVAGLGD